MSSRSQRARTLARRVEQHGQGGGSAPRWSVLVAVWAHLAALLALKLALPLVLPLPRDTRYLEVIRAVGVAPRPAPPIVGPGESRIDPPEPEPGAPLLPDGAHRAPLSPEAQRRADTVRVVRTEAPDDEPPPELRDTISAHDVSADRQTRAPVTSEHDGLPTPESDGITELSASRTIERREGDPEAAMGNRVDGAPSPAVLGGGGGAEPIALAGDGRGAPGEAGDGAEGGPVAAGSAGAQDGASASGASAAPAVTAPVGPDPTRTAGASAPSWWQPLAVRVAPVPSSAPAGAPEPPAPAVEVAKAPVERVGRRTGTQGASRVHDTPPVVAEVSPLPGVRRIAAPGTADPVDELRQALGFGPLDRSKLAPRPVLAGTLGGEGLRDSSPQIAIDVPIAWRTSVSARGTPEGEYFQRAEEQILKRWSAEDLDLHSRAMGVQGDVTVRYRVNPDGRTGGVVVVRSSGNPALDEMARRAIPARLERFPRELGTAPRHHEFTFHYRNPMVSP